MALNRMNCLKKFRNIIIVIIFYISLVSGVPVYSADIKPAKVPDNAKLFDWNIWRSSDFHESAVNSLLNTTNAKCVFFYDLLQKASLDRDPVVRGTALYYLKKGGMEPVRRAIIENIKSATELKEDMDSRTGNARIYYAFLGTPAGGVKGYEVDVTYDQSETSVRFETYAKCEVTSAEITAPDFFMTSYTFPETGNNGFRIHLSRTGKYSGRFTVKVFIIDAKGRKKTVKLYNDKVSYDFADPFFGMNDSAVSYYITRLSYIAGAEPVKLQAKYWTLRAPEMTGTRQLLIVYGSAEKNDEYGLVSVFDPEKDRKKSILDITDKGVAPRMDTFGSERWGYFYVDGRGRCDIYRIGVADVTKVFEYQSSGILQNAGRESMTYLRQEKPGLLYKYRKAIIPWYMWPQLYDTDGRWTRTELLINEKDGTIAEGNTKILDLNEVPPELLHDYYCEQDDTIKF
jgi:hypothetical protein